MNLPREDVPDGLFSGPVRGRAAGINPGNRFEDVRLHVLGEHLDAQRVEHPGGVQVKTRILPDHSRSIISRVDSPDLPFHWTLNPYRGCEHGCIYCYARPSHEHLGLSSGLDFETTILAKHDAPTLVLRELSRASWKGEPIMISGITDPYQPIEMELRITRGCLEVCVERAQPVAMITKNRMITRDIDLLGALAADRAASAAVSVTSLDPRLASRMEPRASSPAHRLEAIRALAGAGIPVGVMVAPIIPGLNDHEIPRVLEAARDAGARSAGYVLLRLPHQIKALFADWLERHFPDRAARIEGLVRQTRGGELYESEFFIRQRGRGPIAEQIARTFAVFAKRYGLDGPRPPLSSRAFDARRARAPGRQLDLF